MAKKKKSPKISIAYRNSDIATVIASRLADVVSKENQPFKTLQPSEGVLILTVGMQKFIISVIDQTDLS